MEKERFIPINEVAEYLTVKTSTIYKWTHEEFIPHYKVKGIIRFKLSEIDNWVKRRKVNGREQRRVEV